MSTHEDVHLVIHIQVLQLKTKENSSQVQILSNMYLKYLLSTSTYVFGPR